MESKFQNDKHYEERIVQAIVTDHNFAEQMMEVLDLDYFNLEHLKEITRIVFDYNKKYHAFPSFKLLAGIVKEIENDTLKEKIMSYFIKITKEPLNGDMEYVKETVLDFCKRRSLALALESSLDLIENKKYDQIIGTVQKALLAGSERDVGHIYLDGLEKRMEQIKRNPIPTPWAEINNLIGGGLSGGELGMIMASTGCHKKGTKILMFDGTFKDVENIVLGDKIMGPDSTHRNVLKLIRNTGNMYKISPTKGKSFIVNDEHILSLKETGKENYINISINDYLNKSNHFKHLYKLYRFPINFPNTNKELLLDPYLLGLLLGDGYLKQYVSFTNSNEVLLNEMKHFSDLYNTKLYERYKEGKEHLKELIFREKDKLNLVKESIEKMNLMGKGSHDKFIPLEYKISSRKDRLKILAGLLDTDGYYNNNTYEYVTASKQLAEDVSFISFSLGFCVTSCEKNVNNEKYYRLHIFGEGLEEIPIKVDYKKAHNRQQIKNALVTGFNIEYVGLDDYYGFLVDKDNLYVMEDFFVTHNCGKSHMLVDISAYVATLGYNVVHYSFELSDIYLGKRIDARISNIPFDDLSTHKQEVEEALKKVKGNIVIKSFPSKSITTLSIKNHYQQLVLRDKKPDLIVVDYVDLLRSSRQYDQKRLEEECATEELRALGQELNVPIWTVTQSNRGSLSAEVLTLKDVAECFSKCMISDLFITMNRQKEKGDDSIGNIYIAKSRLGKDGIKFNVMVDTSRSKFQILSESELPNNEELNAQAVLKKKFDDLRQNGKI